jgi:hypothetical protein
MAKDAFGGNYEAQVLQSGPQPNTGFVPVMKDSDRLALSNVGIGVMVFASDTNKLYVYTGTEWRSVALGA